VLKFPASANDDSMTFSLGRFPLRRMRRGRRDDFTRRLVREARLAPDDLIFPVFVREGTNVAEPVPSMPGVTRVSVDRLFPVVEQALTLGIPAIALFPAVEGSLKTAGAEEAFNPKGLVPRCVRELKKRFPEMGVITDVALDPYTIHGQDGLVDEASGDGEDWKGRLLVRLACRTAVRRGKTLDRPSMRALVELLGQTRAPAVCPHGSPLLMHLSGAYLEREFRWHFVPPR